MKRQRLLIGGLLLLLVLIAAACSPKEKTPVPSPTGPTPSPLPAETVVPTVQPTEEAPPLEIAPNARESLNSYRSRVVWQNAVEGSATETVTVEQEETRTPPAVRMRITSEGGESPGTVEMVRIGNTAWMCSPDEGCIQTQQSAEDAAHSFGEGLLFEPEDIATLSDYQYVGRETVNGIRSRHYTLNLPSSLVAGLARGNVSTTRAEIWVADEPGMPAHVSRFVIFWEGTQDDGKKISGSWTYELYDINKPITIQPPANAPTVPEDIPICAGFTDQTLTGNMILLACPDPAETVAEFYRNEMARLGWTAGEEGTYSGMVTQEWTKGERKASLIISPNDQGGCAVMITVE